MVVTDKSALAHVFCPYLLNYHQNWHIDTLSQTELQDILIRKRTTFLTVKNPLKLHFFTYLNENLWVSLLSLSEYHFVIKYETFVS